MFLQYQIDLEQLREDWSLFKYTPEEEKRAQGQAFYVLDLEDKIRGMLTDD